MSKQPSSKTYPPKDKDLHEDLATENLAVSDRELALQLHSQLEISQHELNHAAREIHDNLGHLANLVHIHLKLLLETQHEEQKQKVEDISALVSDLNREIKQLSINLTAAGADTAAFDQLLLKEILRLKRLNLFQVVYIEPEHWPDLPPHIGLVLFRMIQEILNNVLKHSNASLLKVQVIKSGSFLNIHLEDNGVGYDPTSEPDHPQLGMKHLYERSRMIQVQLQVKSKQQEGTSVHLRIPIP